MEARSGGRADALYRTGPEMQALEADTVAVGRIAGLERDEDPPAQEGAMVAHWTARGTLTDIRALKGGVPPGERPVERREHSTLTSGASTEPAWTAEYGPLIEGGLAVAFGGADPLLVPSGEGEVDLVALVSKTIRIAMLPDDAVRAPALLDWIGTGPTDAERKAALRLALRARLPWPGIETAMGTAWPDALPETHLFFTGASAFGIKQGLWPDDTATALRFVCATFSEADDRASVPLFLQLKSLLAWAEREQSDARTAIANRITACWKARASAGKVGAELQAFYDQMDPEYVRE